MVGLWQRRPQKLRLLVKTEKTKSDKRNETAIRRL